MDIPLALARSTPRPVRLSRTGRFVAVLVVALVAGAVVAFAGLLSAAAGQRARAAAFASDGRRMEADIVSVRRADNSRRSVRYRYGAGGTEVEGSVRMRARPGLAAGGRLTIVYLPDTPEVHYVEARGLRQVPLWLVPFAPLVLLAGAGLLWRELRAQRRLVEYGRPVVATVTAAQAQRHQHGRHFKVTYEFRLLNGASRRGAYQLQKEPPASGSPLVVLYDRERPEHNRRYPVCLVRVASGH
jgi:hypothetical protein